MRMGKYFGDAITMHLCIEKKTQFGWALATTPDPVGDWTKTIPEADAITVAAMATDYIESTPKKPARHPVPNPTCTFWEEFLDGMDACLDLDEAAALFGEERWFQWEPGNSRAFKTANYPLFAILGDIDNDYNIPPIAAARGLPDDVSPETLQFYSGGVENTSHVSFAEFMMYPWNQELTQHCFVCSGDYDKLIEARKTNPQIVPPRAFFVLSKASNTKLVTPAEHDLIRSGSMLQDPQQLLCLEFSYQQKADAAVGTIRLPKMFGELATYGEPDDVRMVFWFDRTD